MQGNPKHAANFDRIFTGLKMESTPVDHRIVRQKANAFADFSYCNPSFLQPEHMTRL